MLNNSTTDRDRIQRRLRQIEALLCTLNMSMVSDEASLFTSELQEQIGLARDLVSECSRLNGNGRDGA